MAKEKDDLFTEDNEVPSNWFKFENEGDKVSGELVGKEYQEGTGDFPAQHVYILENEDGRVNVGISDTKSKSGTIQRAEQAAMGDTVGFEFAEEKEPKTKGHQPFKLIKVYIKKNTDVNSDDIDKAADAFGED